MVVLKSVELLCPERFQFPVKESYPCIFVPDGVTLALPRICCKCTPVRALDWEDSLPLHDACREGQLQMTQLLVQCFPRSVCTANMRSELALFPAVRSGNVDLAAWLVQVGPPSMCAHVLQTTLSLDDVLG